jgi:hypothetical protein
MQIRPLLLSLGALLFSAASASAQFVELLTEAPVTFSVTLQTSTTTETATSRTSSLATTKLTQAQVLGDLLAAGIIPGDSISGWSLVAVRAPAPDLVFVDASFTLYAINNNLDTRIAVPTNKFAAVSFASAAKYVEKHQGQYVYSSTGTRSTHVVYDYRPSFSAAGSQFSIGSAESAGLAKINFVARDLSDNIEVFTFVITSFSASTRGGFSSSVTGNASPDGIMTLTLNVGSPKLVAADRYPEVNPNPFAGL